MSEAAKQPVYEIWLMKWSTTKERAGDGTIRFGGHEELRYWKTVGTDYQAACAERDRIQRAHPGRFCIREARA